MTNLRGRHPAASQSSGSEPADPKTITLAWVAVVERFLAVRDVDVPVSVLVGELLRQCGDKDYLLRF
jgi:hypothetical protein